MTSFPIRLFFKARRSPSTASSSFVFLRPSSCCWFSELRQAVQSSSLAVGSAVEWLIEFVRDNIVYQVMGELRGKRYVPMITTVFCTLLVFNLCGIIRLQHRGKRVHHAASGVRHVVLLPVLDCRHP